MCGVKELRTCLRKGDTIEADRELTESRALDPDLPFLVYLDGLCKCFQGTNRHYTTQRRERLVGAG